MDILLKSGDIVYVRFLVDDCKLVWYEGDITYLSEDQDENGKYYNCKINYECDATTEERKLWIEDYGQSFEGSWMTKQKNDTLLPMFNWLGGKRKEIPFIQKHIPKSYGKYVEPFVGGGALLFHLRPNLAFINDTNNDVINLYDIVKMGYGTKLYDCLKNKKTPRNGKLRDAYDFMIERNSCFRGAYNPKRQKVDLTPKSVAKYECFKNIEYEKTLKNATIMCGDFKVAMDAFDDPDTFIFIDPPYEKCYNNYGNISFTDIDFHRLYYAIKNSKAMCLMIVSDTPLVRTLFSEYIHDEYYVVYSSSHKKVKHLVIKNY